MGVAGEDGLLLHGDFFSVLLTLEYKNAPYTPITWLFSFPFQAARSLSVWRILVFLLLRGHGETFFLCV